MPLGHWEPALGLSRTYNFRSNETEPLQLFIQKVERKTGRKEEGESLVFHTLLAIVQQISIKASNPDQNEKETREQCWPLALPNEVEKAKPREDWGGGELCVNELAYRSSCVCPGRNTNSEIESSLSCSATRRIENIWENDQIWWTPRQAAC